MPRYEGKGVYHFSERNGEKMPGFDKGNSPFEYAGDQVKGQRIAFTTTNGTQAIDKAKMQSSSDWIIPERDSRHAISVTQRA